MISRVTMVGFGFIEILVSLLIVAMGAVGMALLHSRSLQYNQATYHYSQSIILATDMLERLRTNQSIALKTGLYQVAAGDAVSASCSDEAYPDSCEEGQCSPEQLALHDTRQWKFQLLCQLPAATGIVSYKDDVIGRIYTITISFEDSSSGLNPADLVLRSGL